MTLDATGSLRCETRGGVAPVLLAAPGGSAPGAPIQGFEWQRDGQWSGWRIEGNSLAFQLGSSDPSPLFVAERGDGVALSVNLLALLDHVPDLELDAEAISTFLHLGFFEGNATAFRHVRALRPGDVGRFDANGLRWSAPAADAPAECRLPLAEVTDAFVAAMRRAIAAAAPSEPFVHPLSGGRDSRYLLLELCRQGRPPRECVTLADSEQHPDVVVARAVCSALGLPHRVLPPVGDGFERELVNAEATHLCADEHSWLVSLAAALRHLTPVVFDGLGGGTLCRASFAGDPRAVKSLREQAASLLDRFRPPSERGLELASTLLGVELPGRAVVEERVSRALSGLSGEPNPIVRFMYLNRTCREVSLVPRSMYRAIGRVETPFLHPEVLALLRSLPPRFFAENPTFQDHATRVAFPESAGLPIVGKDAVFPARRRHLRDALSPLRRSLWWRRQLDAEARAVARQLRGVMKANRLTWLLMLTAAAGSRGARGEMLAHAERALGRVRGIR